MFLKDRNPEENKPLQLIQSSDLVDSFFLLELPVVVANECRGEYVSSSSPGVPRCWNQERGAIQVLWRRVLDAGLQTAHPWLSGKSTVLQGFLP